MSKFGFLCEKEFQFYLSESLLHTLHTRLIYVQHTPLQNVLPLAPFLRLAEKAVGPFGGVNEAKDRHLLGGVDFEGVLEKQNRTQHHRSLSWGREMMNQRLDLIRE